MITFKWLDCFLFIFMLVISVLIGLYYGFIKHQTTASDYLLGGKQMGIWPTSMSMVSSQLSGLVIISLSADVYRYGITFWLIVPILICVSLTIYHVYLPVFYKLNITSIYEYLHIRFDNKVRIFASILFALQKLLALPIVIYVPALALAQVTGINIHFITPVVCGVCIFYTTIGGMKAIVQTDALQFTILMGSLVLAIAVGVWKAGGFAVIFERAYVGNRLHISQLSGLIIISLPADTYRYGISFWLTVPMMTFVSLAAYYIYLPVFYKLEITSIYEYLNLRFNNKVRIYASVLFTIHMVLYLPIIIYVPALALGQVTGVSIHYITPIVCSICILYTTLGGMKAIVKTDSLQFGVMLGTLFVVVALGIWSSGGFVSIFKKAYEGSRLNISFDFDLYKRDTFWSCTIGTFFMMTNHFPCSQNFVQKCLSLPSFKSIKSVLIISTIGVGLVKTFCIVAGLIMSAKYSDCDPLETKMIQNLDQLLPMYVLDVASFIPGFPGLFLSGIFSAALSALSASLNCLAATIYQDFISSFIPKDTPEERISMYLKLIVIIIGIIATVMVFVIEKLGSLLVLTFSLAGVTGGSLLGLFSVGMLVPRVNSKGALYGGITSLVVNGWLIFGGLYYRTRGIIKYPSLPSSTENCNATIINALNLTIIEPLTNSANSLDSQHEVPFFLYKLSVYWFVAIGALIVLFIGVLVSYFTKDDKIIDKDCISPIMYFLLQNIEDKPPEYDTIETAKRIVNDN